METRARAFCLTINNPKPSDYILLMTSQASRSFRYLIIGKEVGKKGTYHYQCYIYFNNQMTITTLKRKYAPRAHIEIAKGSPEQNRKYCSKDHDFEEYGELPHQGRAQWDRIESAMTNPRENPALYMQYRRVYKEILSSERTSNLRKIDICFTRELVDKLRTFKTKDIYFSPECPHSHAFENYSGESIAVWIYNSAWFEKQTLLEITLWQSGFSPNIKSGYNTIPFNPSIILLCFHDQKDLEHVYRDTSMLDDLPECQKVMYGLDYVDDE